MLLFPLWLFRFFLWNRKDTNTFFHTVFFFLFNVSFSLVAFESISLILVLSMLIMIYLHGVFFMFIEF